MKQGNVYTKAILIILLIAVVCYLGYAGYTALHDPFSTVLAMEYEAGAGCRVPGYVVRDERMLLSPSAITVLGRQEGEKVGVGQTVATGYETADAQERQAEMSAVRAQLDQLEFAYSYHGDASDSAALDNEILEELCACAQAAVRRDMGFVADNAAGLKGLILRRSTDEADLSYLRIQMEALKEKLRSLETISSGETSVITAPVSGCFSGTVDGYESALTPERLKSFTISDLEAVEPVQPPANACGRLISSTVWYFAAAVPSELLRDAEVGDRVEVTFSHDLTGQLPMRMSRIGDEEDGERLLVLESSDRIQDITLLRRQSVDIVFDSYAGLRVPKQALRLDEENRPGVFVLESAAARWKPVEILYDNGESYVVALDRENTSNLWPGDEIIVGAKNLYDGKVVTLS